MATITLTQSVHQVFNEFDSHGSLLGLPRLPNEKNANYKQRILDVFVHPASATYQGLVNGITRELGLKLSPAMTIDVVKDSNGNPLLPLPAVVFENTKCTLYNDYSINDVLLTIDRFDINGNAWTLSELASAINGTTYFTATLDPNAIGDQRSLTIYNQSSVRLQVAEAIGTGGNKVVLAHKNIIPKTVSIDASELNLPVTTLADVNKPGTYYLDHTNGVLYMYSVPDYTARIRYMYWLDSIVVNNSPVILLDLQADDIQTKMFEQVQDEDGVYHNGHPTRWGADIINELLSVYPSTYGK